MYAEPGRALLARDALSAHGLGVFCPVEQLTRRRKIHNRNKYRLETVVSPVFGRYMFACGDAAEVLAVRGVADVIRNGREAQAVPVGVIEELRSLTRAVDGVGDLMSVRDVTRLSLGFRGDVGDTFKFAGGPFAGFLGVISSLRALDVSGEVKAYVELLGGRQEICVPHKHVGAIVKRQVAAA